MLFRSGDKLKIIYNIPEEIDCLLPPLLLQPIVENAVKHGVLEKIEGGTVEITAIDNEIETELIVKDDGVGMSPETLSSLFNEDNNSDSIGLNNVNSRLKNKYGKEYRLKIDSKLNKGTIVTMTIPKKQRGKVV